MTGSSDLVHPEEQYTPSSEYPTEAYKVKQWYTNCDDVVMNKILASIYDKINYLKNNLDSAYLNLINQSIKVGLASFVKLSGTVAGVNRTITGSSTLFNDKLKPGDTIRVTRSDSFSYYKVESITSQTSLTIVEQINSADAFTGLTCHYYSVSKDYETVDSAVTSKIDPPEDLLYNIEHIGDYVGNLNTKINNLIESLGFNQETGEGNFGDQDLQERLAEIEADTKDLTIIVNNIIRSSGFNATGEIGQYSSTTYVAQGDTLQEAISALDTALSTINFASASILNALLITVGANADGTHAGFGAGRSFLKDGNPNYKDAILDLDSKMNSWPGMFDVIVDDGWASSKKPDYICTTLQEMVDYINNYGGNLNVYIKPSSTGEWTNDALNNALELYVDKASGCTFYGDNTLMSASFVLTKSGATAPFNTIKFYNFEFKISEVTTADGYKAHFTLKDVGYTQLGTQTTDQIIRFDSCKFRPFVLSTPADVSDRPFIDINNAVNQAVTDTTIQFINCVTTGFVSNAGVTDKDFVAPLLKHTASGTSDSDIKLHIINSDLFGKWDLTAGGGGSPDLTVIKELLVKDSKLRDHFQLFVLPHHSGSITFENSKLEHALAIVGQESDDYFIEIYQGDYPAEQNNVRIKDCFIKHYNMIFIESHQIYDADNYYESTRANNNHSTLNTASIEYSAVEHNKTGNKYRYDPTQMDLYHKVSTFDVNPIKLYIDDLSFYNSTNSVFVTGGGEIEATLYIYDNGHGGIGVIKNIDIYHNAALTASKPLFNSSLTKDDVIVENLQYFQPFANSPLQGFAGWEEGVNQNFVYIGEGAVYTGTVWNALNNSLLDLGEFTTAGQLTLDILRAGLYRLTIINTDPATSAGLTTANVAITFNNPPFTDYTDQIFPYGQNFGAIQAGIVGAGGALANQSFEGETFSNIYELKPGALITINCSGTTRLRVTLERIK